MISFLSTIIISKVVLTNVYVIRGNILGNTAYLCEWKLGIAWKRCGKFPVERILDYLWKRFKLFIFQLNIIYENSNAF